MEEHQLWLTTQFNHYLAGPANAILNAVGQTAERPDAPWQNWIVMELLVVALMIVGALIIRSSLSAQKPGFIQHLFESLYGFIKQTAEEVGMHHPEKYLGYFATVFFFILCMNLIGMIPAFESPTMFAWVPAGIAVWTFLYYNYAGFRSNGFGYLKHFVGPVALLAPLMIPLEIISHLIRPLSLTVRLYGNMFAGEEVTLVFIDLTKLAIPVIFMALHVFVAFVQAYVFTILTMIYVATATAHEH